MACLRHAGVHCEQATRAWLSIVVVQFCFREGRRRKSLCSSNMPGNYRFGRTAAKPVRAIARRSARGANRFFSAMLRIIAEAKLRRLARELSVRGVRYPSVRLEGDRFVADQNRSPSK